MKRTFLTVCSTENYLPGVLALKESLVQTKTKYGLTVLISKNTSIDLENMLKLMDIGVIRLDKEIHMPNEIIENNKINGFSHWNNTLDKLCMFELDEYEKIVYLDSDMLVLENIDELFEAPHMSAVVAGNLYPGFEEWDDLNSGCLVFKPQKGLLNEFISILPKVAEKRTFFGDQDVLQVYYDKWADNKELKLDQKYNVFLAHIDFYTKNAGYKLHSVEKEKNIAVVHFDGKSKPWMKNILQISVQYIALLVRGRYRAAKLLMQYRKLLKKINKKILVSTHI